MFRRFCKRLLTPPLVVLAAIIMFAEEWLWHRMVAAMAWLGRLPIVHRIEMQLALWPPYAALMLLMLPGVLLLPIKLVALYFMAHGHVLSGLLVIAAAKILGTAFVARLFTVCRPALMSIDWLRRLTEWVVGVRDRLYARIKSMAAWRRAARMMESIRRFLKRFRGDGVGRRWQAIRRWLRRKSPDAATPSEPSSGAM